MEIVDLNNAEHYTWGSVCDGWHLLKSAGLSVIEERVPPGGAQVRHYHARAHQIFYVLAGEATLEIDGRTLVLGARQSVSITPTVPHRLRNAGSQDLRFLVVSSPPSHGDRINVEATV